MVPDSKGSGLPAWPTGASLDPAPVYIHESPRSLTRSPSPLPAAGRDGAGPVPSRRGLALEALRITSSSTNSSTSASSIASITPSTTDFTAGSRVLSSSHGPVTPTSSPATSPGVLAGRGVAPLERKSGPPDAPPQRTEPDDGSPARASLRRLGAGSPGMARFHAMLGHLPALPLAREAAKAQGGRSEGRLRLQLAGVLAAARLHEGEAPTLPQACLRLVGAGGSDPALLGLAAGTLALALAPAGRPPSQADRQQLVDALLDEARRDTVPRGTAQSVVAVLEGLCEAWHGTGHWMPQATPFVRLVLDRLLAPASSPRALEVLRVLTTRMLLLRPPAQLPDFLALVLAQAFLPEDERAARLGALVDGLADKASPPPTDACVGRFAGYVLEAGLSEADRIVFAQALARHPALWEQACQPRVLAPAAFGRLLLAATGLGAPEAQPDRPARSGRDKAAARSVTTRSGEAVETKSGGRRVATSPVDRVVQVLALPLSLQEGAESRLAREVVAVHQALAGDDPARETLETRILLLAPDALELTNAALACGWGIAVGAEALDGKAFAALADSFSLPQTSDPILWLANARLQLGLAAARDLNALSYETDVDPELRAQVAQVCREARGPLDDARFAGELMRHAELDEPPLAAAARLDDLVRQFSGPDFDLLVTARTYLLDHAQALQGVDTFAAAYGLDQLSQVAGRIQAAAYDVVLRRYNQCLWMVDPAECGALLAVAQKALAFLEGEGAALQDRDCPLRMTRAQRAALANDQLKLQGVIEQLAPLATTGTSGPRDSQISPSKPEGKGPPPAPGRPEAPEKGNEKDVGKEKGPGKD